MNVFLAAPREAAIQILCLALPLLLVAVVLRLLEILVQRRLARRFGWNVVLLTGWLGTPIHELSHAAMCWVFRHRIVDMALFRPDVHSGRLGYVYHAYNGKSLYQVLGNFFIGFAPLAGGTLAMYALLWLCYPAAASRALGDGSVGDAIARGDVAAAAQQVSSHALGILRSVVEIQNLATTRFWLFLYGTLCIASHMAPSRSDYRGSQWGAILLVAAILVVNLLVAVLGGAPARMTLFVASAVGVLLGLWALSILFCVIAAILVLLVTTAFDLFAERSR